MEPITASIWLVKNWRLVGAVIATVMALGIAYYIYDAIGDARESQIAIDAYDTVAAVQEKKDEIRNNRPNRAGVINSLCKQRF